MNLSSFSKDELCEIFDRINSWQWDERLGEEPKNWDNMRRHRKWYQNPFKTTRGKIIKPIMLEIECRVGNKCLLKHHHLHNLGKTEEEFQEWWENKLYAQSCKH